jgi:hypothetical protein
VNCAIRIISLDNDDKYEALSYVWGERNDSEVIEISGHRVRITRNLHAALRRLRLSGQTRTIWIDQLCINQLDNDERGRQVAMMRDIYRRCSSCIIWLGEVEGNEKFDIDDAREVFRFIEFAADPTPTNDDFLPVMFQNTPRGERTRSAFGAFSMYGNPWWSRVWTIQEAIVPRSGLFVWGTLTIWRELVTRAARHLRGNKMPEQFNLAFRTHRLRHTPLLRRLLYPMHGFRHAELDDGPLDLFMRWRHRDATNPRDKVYALLGLIPADALPSAVHCDYNVPVTDLYQNVTADLINYEQDLRPLVGSREIPHRTPGLASWAIDFACINHVGRRQLKWWNHSHRYQMFSAAWRQPSKAVTLQEGKVLALDGVFIDEIAEVNAVYMVHESEKLDDGRLLQVVNNARGLLDPFKLAQLFPHQYVTGCSWKTAFTRTMLGGLTMNEYPVRRVVEQDEELFEALVEKLGTPGRDEVAEEAPQLYTFRLELEEDPSLHNRGPVVLLDDEDEHIARPLNVHESFCGMVPNHRFFITQKGYIGMGPPDTERGDQVWIFLGGQVPFIARKVEQDNVYEGNRRLHLVGDAYVHGIMDGEAFEKEHEVHSVWLV